jgi:DNA-binding LacI/PurR family transcriptional regulator
MSRRKSLYPDSARAVKQWLDTRIAGGELTVGQRLPAERAWADELRINRLTLRRAVAALCRDGLLRKTTAGKTELAAAAPAAKNAFYKTVGVISELRLTEPHDDSFYESWMCAIGTGAGNRLQRAGYDAWMTAAEGWSAAEVDWFFQMRPAGLLLASLPETAILRRALAAARHGGVAVAAVGSDEILADCDRVYTDHAGGGAQLAAHLAKRGCRRVISIGSTPCEVEWRRRREQGIAAALKKSPAVLLATIEIKELTSAPRPENQAQFEAQARTVAGYLAEFMTDKKPLEGILAQNDVFGFLVARACRWFGRDPVREVLITGYDNMWERAKEREWEAWTPAATADKENARCGEIAAELLLSRIADKLSAPIQAQVLEPRLVFPTTV